MQEALHCGGKWAVFLYPVRNFVCDSQCKTNAWNLICKQKTILGRFVLRAPSQPKHQVKCFPGSGCADSCSPHEQL